MKVTREEHRWPIGGICCTICASHSNACFSVFVSPLTNCRCYLKAPRGLKSRYWRSSRAGQHTKKQPSKINKPSGKRCLTRSKCCAKKEATSYRSHNV